MTDESKLDSKLDQHDEQGEVEAHKRAAHDEHADEAGDDDDVEAHRHIRTAAPKLD